MPIASLYPDLRVLLVDDEPFIRRVTVQVLKTLQVSEVHEAENGLDATSSLAQREYDLLITDIQMPEQNGIELIKQIRIGNTAADRGLRTLVVTSFSNTEVLGSCLSLDINGFLVKPITPASAGKKIQRALSEKINLRSVESYISVQSDLQSLVPAAKEIQKKVNASIPRDTTKPLPPNSIIVSVIGLKTGMILREDLLTKNGQKLLSAGQVLNEGLINRLVELESLIGGDGIYVQLAAK